MSVFEIVKMHAAEDQSDALERGLAAGVHAIAGHPACGGVRVFRSVEHPDAFVLVAEWDSVEAHQTYFDSPNSPEFRSHVEGLRDLDRVDVAHYVLVEDAPGDGGAT
jgi:quinol monooxygenase YgiN